MARLCPEKPVLVLDGHSRAAVEVIQSLGARGIEVHVAAEHLDAPGFGSRYAHQRLLQPAETSALADWLTEIDERSQYSLVVPSTENSLQALRLQGESSVLWRKALLPPQDSLELTLSKEHTLSLAVKVGVPVPTSRLITQGTSLPPPYAEFPVVLKPVYSVVVLGGHASWFEPVIVRDEVERERHLLRLLPSTSVQEQQYVRGCGVGVECLYVHGHMAWRFVHERVHEMPLTGGGSTYRKSIPPDAVLVSAAKRLLDALNWHGVAMVEFKCDDDGTFYLVEINPRLWGSLALAIDAGMDFPWGLWLMANRHPVGPQPVYRIPHYSRFLPGDVDWMKENFKADHDDPLLMTRPLLKSMVEYLRPLVGRESWDHFKWSDPVIFLKQIQQVVNRNFSSLLKRLERLNMARKLRYQHSRLLHGFSQKRGMSYKLLFVCYGNICRSPFAEAYAKVKLPEVQIQSAGFHDEEKRLSPGHLLSAAAKFGVDLTTHRSRCLNVEMIEQADLVVVMDLMNYESLARTYPRALSKTACLGLFAKESWLEIDDPYLFSIEQTTVVLRQITLGVDGIAETLIGRQETPGDSPRQ